MTKVIGKGEKECYITISGIELETLADRFTTIPTYSNPECTVPFMSQMPWCLRVAPLTKEEKKKGKK